MEQVKLVKLTDQSVHPRRSATGRRYRWPLGACHRRILTHWRRNLGWRCFWPF